MEIIHEGKRLFSHHELECECCGIVRLAPGFAGKLLELRLAVAMGMDPTSCCRCPVHNSSPEVKGHRRSLHLTINPVWDTDGTCGIDIRRKDSAYDKALIEKAWALGWSIGLSNGFIHLDRRSDYTELPQHLFYYKGYVGENFDYMKEL